MLYAKEYSGGYKDSSIPKDTRNIFYVFILELPLWRDVHVLLQSLEEVSSSSRWHLICYDHLLLYWYLKVSGMYQFETQNLPELVGFP